MEDRRFGAATALVALFMGGAALAQGGGLTVWDKDGDGRLSREEFRAGPAGLRTGGSEGGEASSEPAAEGGYALSDLDLDGDGVMSPAEFAYGAGEAGLGDDFEDWDTNDDGAIDAAEYVVGYERSGPAPAAIGVDQERRAAEARYDFANWDANADGRLDSAEFARFREAFTLLEPLAAFDADGDGALSAAEHAAIPRRTTYTGGRAETDRPFYEFETYDLDGDGAIDAAEYAAFERQNLQRATGFMIETLDADGDQQVTRAEFESWSRSLRSGNTGAEPPLFTGFDTNRDGVLDLSEMQGLQNALGRF